MVSKLTISQAFNAMEKFLTDYYQRTFSASSDIKNLLNNMRFAENKTKNSTIWNIWIKCVEESLKEPVESKPFLELKK